MLHITLTDGRQFQLETVSPVALKNEGTYGNGSIDWEDEGLYLFDIAAQIGVENALAALVNGELLPMNTFVKKDCTLEYVMANDEIGKGMIDRTVLFLTAYGIKSLNKTCKRIEGRIEDDRVYYDFAAEGGAFTAEELQQAEHAIAQAISANYSAGCRKFPYYTSKKELLAQGETYILEYIDLHDDYGPVSMQVMDNFADLDQGLLLGNLSILKEVQLTQELIDDIYRVYATAKL